MSLVIDMMQHALAELEGDEDLKIHMRYLLDTFHDYSHANKDVLNRITRARILAGRIDKRLKELDIMADPDKKKGLYPKWYLERINDPDQKHDNCFVFVLDLTHDVHARFALIAYIESCKEDYPILAEDLREKLLDITIK